MLEGAAEKEGLHNNKKKKVETRTTGLLPGTNNYYISMPFKVVLNLILPAEKLRLTLYSFHFFFFFVNERVGGEEDRISLCSRKITLLEERSEGSSSSRYTEKDTESISIVYGVYAQR